MRGLIVYVDWENAWLEYLHRTLPGLRLKNAHTPSLFPAVTQLTSPALSDLGRFHEVLKAIITAEFKREPLFMSFAALWNELPVSAEAGFPQTLVDCGYEVHRPQCPAKHSTPKERENFCDAYLIIQMLNDWFIQDSATKSHTRSGRFNDQSVSDIVIVSGDNIFCQAARFFHDHSEANITFLTWSTCVSKHVIAQAKRLERVRYKFVDGMPEYARQTASLAAHDALRRCKGSKRPGYFECLVNSAICRLTDQRHRDVEVAKVKSWMVEWLHYWRHCANIPTPHSAGKLDRQFNYLRQRGVLVDSKLGNKPAVRLNNRSPLVKHAHAMMRENQAAFEFLYDVPPAYYRSGRP